MQWNPESQNYTGCHKYVPIDQRLNFRAHRGYNLKRSTARCAKIKELDLAMLGTQTASIFIPLSAGLRRERSIKYPQMNSLGSLDAAYSL